LTDKFIPHFTKHTVVATMKNFMHVPTSLSCSFEDVKLFV